MHLHQGYHGGGVLQLPQHVGDLVAEERAATGSEALAQRLLQKIVVLENEFQKFLVISCAASELLWAPLERVTNPWELLIKQRAGKENWENAWGLRK